MSDPIRGRSLRLGTLILFAALASPSWSSDPFQIDSAYWNAEYSRLTVRGKGNDGRNVVVANAGASGTVIGEDRAVDAARFRVTRNGVALVTAPMLGQEGTVSRV